ncbi:MAG: hypothetical protein OK457_07665 [Thaumarchaeota archaeon]|nr:hypothetical protein [Nitrososphaerota archaeon]
MNPTDFAWSSLQSITGLQPKDIKLLVDEIEYPTLGTDAVGYVLHLSMPLRPRDNVYSLHGMYFDNDKNGRSSMWRMYRASVYHLCLHAISTDYRVYRSISKYTPSTNNFMFAISVTEDYAILGHMRSKWPGLLLDCAYASRLTALRFKPAEIAADPGTCLAANILSYSLIGKPVYSLGKELNEQALSLHESLKELEASAEKYYSSIGRKKEQESPIIGLDSKKINSVKKILDLFTAQSFYMEQIPAPPFADNHGPNDLFESSLSGGESVSFDSILKESAADYGLNLSASALKDSEKQLEIESQSVLGDWEYSISEMKRLADNYRVLDPKTHFEDFLFPKEDYAEFVRTRAKLIGPIRLILDQLRSVKSNLDDTVKESGNVDMPTAIQVIASKSSRRDVFYQEENETKSEAWAILIDSSKSLETFAEDIRELVVCLAEVAKDLIPNPNSWGCYSFNENLYIIKDFSELYGMRTKSRIGGLGSGLKTYLPDALRMAANKLKNTQEQIKVLLVASDGFPLGYEGIDEDLVSAIQQINRAGIQLIGMGIGSSSIKKYFRSNCLISSPFDLMKSFVKIYIELAGS